MLRFTIPHCLQIHASDETADDFKGGLLPYTLYEKAFEDSLDLAAEPEYSSMGAAELPPNPTLSPCCCFFPKSDQVRLKCLSS